jgi:hypothetical protein
LLSQHHRIKKVKVYYDESTTGAGKTARAIASLCRQPCKALFITERKAAFDELERDFQRAARHAGTCPLIRLVHGDTTGRGGSVVNEIEGLPERYESVSHVIVIATHAALLRSDFSEFYGWRIIIDEVPAFLDFEEKRTHLDAEFFERHYALECVKDRWHAVSLTAAGHAISTADIRADESHAHLGVFHSRVKEASRPEAKRVVLTNLSDWGEMGERKVQWCWASVFSLRELAAFDRVELLGNRFRSNIGSILTEWLEVEDVEWVAIPLLTNARRFERRPLTIHYFSERRASKSLFGSEQGQAALAEIGQYLAKVLPQSHSIWTANDTSELGAPTPKSLLGLPEPDYLTPRQAGTNQHMSVSYAAMIFSAKPSANMRSLLSALGIENEAWTRSVEFETILQFMTRTSVRDPVNSTPVELWVFDREQAAYLRDYFNDLGHVAVKMCRASLELDLSPASKGGRPPARRTPDEQEAWRAERRRKDAARKRISRKKAA